jgi:DNA-binding XRE family transcriptional regulator
VSFEQTLAESPELRAYLESDEGKSGMRELVLQHQIYKLRTLRKSLGITQVQLAARLGVSQIRISQIENGRLEKFELGTLIRYVEALGGELELGVAIGGERFSLLEIAGD